MASGARDWTTAFAQDRPRYLHRSFYKALYIIPDDLLKELIAAEARRADNRSDDVKPYVIPAACGETQRSMSANNRAQHRRPFRALGRSDYLRNCDRNRTGRLPVSYPV